VQETILHDTSIPEMPDTGARVSEVMERSKKVMFGCEIRDRQLIASL